MTTLTNIMDMEESEKFMGRMKTTFYGANDDDHKNGVKEDLRVGE